MDQTEATETVTLAPEVDVGKVSLETYAAEWVGSSTNEASALRLSAELSLSTVDEQKRTVDCVWYAGATVPRFNYRTDEEYDLTLDMAGCRMGRLNGGAPVFDNHWTGGAVDQLGIVRKAWADGNTGVATLQFSERDSVTPIWNDIKSGIVSKLSPGVWIYKMKDVTPEGDPPIRKQMLAVDWEPFEISLAPIPADAGTTFLAAQEPVTEVLSDPAANQSTGNAPKEIPMDEKTLAGDGARNDEAVALAAAEAVKAERTRVSRIKDMGQKFRIDEKVVNELVDNGATLDEARAKIFDLMATREEAVKTIPATVTADVRDKNRECMEAAMLVRYDPNGNGNLADKAQGLVGRSLMDLARIAVEQTGLNVNRLSNDEIVKAALMHPIQYSQNFGGSAMSTSDFPNILANVANKTLQSGYQQAPRSFLPFSRMVTANDFKTLTRVQLSDIAALPKVNEAGEFKRTALSESKNSFNVATYGAIVSINRQVIINDDLGAFTRVPYELGKAAARMENETFWSMVIANGNMADGKAIFAASGHGNLNVGAGNALALAGLDTARQAFRKQTGPKGAKLNLTPQYIVVPVELELTVEQLLYPNGLAPTTPAGVVPASLRSLTPIVEPLITTAHHWYLFCSPSVIDTFEYAYLSGNQGVYIETRNGFDVDGVEIKAREDFGCGVVEYRGIQKNATS